MAVTDGGTPVDPNKTFYGGEVEKHPTSRPTPRPPAPATDTVHDDSDEALVSEKSPESAKLYIKQFKKTLNREGDKQAPK